MPRIFDNIDAQLLPALRHSLQDAVHADFCVGYFNLRGWQKIDDLVEMLPSNGAAPCRVLVGMNVSPHDELKAARSLTATDDMIDQATAARLRRKAAEQFREQLIIGAPTNADEDGLRRLSRQLRERKVSVKLHARYPLHAKLYLLQRNDYNNPMTGFVGSSNLTVPGLSKQGELNVDVLEHDACEKLQAWFNARWNDNRSYDISDDLADIIDESWAREAKIPPYHIYLKMIYHLSREARAGLTEFRIPRDLEGLLFDYQKSAVQIAAHHLNKRGGVVIGDVVGLGKTLMATVLARIFEDDHGISTLIICPTNLESMWKEHAARYGLRANVITYGSVANELPKIQVLDRYKQIIIDESHNLRNREGQRYAAIQEYIQTSDSKVILLTATPYNKQYLDLSSQLRLFVDPEADIGIRPEAYIRSIGETEFIARHQSSPRTLAAFDHSQLADDWRELMRLYLVRRTRSFIIDNYAETDETTDRKYLTFPDGTRSYFPVRQPRTLGFTVDEQDPTDTYARLYSPEVVQVIERLRLPRYGLGNYTAPLASTKPTKAEQERLDNLSRAGQRLMGFSRTNLFKRLESGGPAFIQSVDRHILRNYVYLHAIENGLDLPIGTQDFNQLDPGQVDIDTVTGTDDDAISPEATNLTPEESEASYRHRAAVVYEQYVASYKRRFNWLRPSLFDPALARDLCDDAEALAGVLAHAGPWRPEQDAKLDQLERLLRTTHPNDKVLIFTQFADTVDYLAGQLTKRGLKAVAGVTGGTTNPTLLARRFSPISNKAQVAPEDELRVLIATDVLSEGQNLQDCHIVVNYDLPWAIIRLIQRAGRVDRIGQQAETISVYSFMPAEGVEQLLQLRARVLQRLRENAEVVGSDEAFFEDGGDLQSVLDLYNEKSGILDGDGEGEVDLSSQALAIWNTAIGHDPSLKSKIEKLPDVVYSSRAHAVSVNEPEGVLVYVRTPQDYDALAWMGADGKPVTESQLRILQIAACQPNTPAIERNSHHHDLVQTGVGHLMAEASKEGGQLGRPSGARYKTYVRLKRFIETNSGTLWVKEEHRRALQEIYRYPLRQTATDTLNRHLRSGISDEQLAEIVFNLRADDRLCVVPANEDDDTPAEPRIICSLGLWKGPGL